MKRRNMKRYGYFPRAIEDVDGLEFRFYSKDEFEPPHVHVVFKNGPPGKKTKIKFWLGPPVRIASTQATGRLNAREIRHAREIIEERHEEIQKKWQDFFGLRASRHAGVSKGRKG